MTHILERDVQKGIKDYLMLKRVLVFKHRNVGIKKPDGHYIPLPEDELGISDIIGCLKGGRFLAIEVKAPGKKPTEAQQQFIDRVNKQGGLAFVADDLSQVVARLEALV